MITYGKSDLIMFTLPTLKIRYMLKHFRSCVSAGVEQLCLLAKLWYFIVYDKQETQLSQRDRAALLVIEYFAKSLKFTQGHSKRHCCVGCL